MIIVHGTIPIREDQRDRALTLARRMAAATREEPGCLSYDFYVGLADPNTLMLFQEWETMDDLMVHFKTPHMEDFLKELPDVLSGSITTRRFAVQSVEEDDDGESDAETQAPPIIH